MEGQGNGRWTTKRGLGPQMLTLVRRYGRLAGLIVELSEQGAEVH